MLRMIARRRATPQSTIYSQPYLLVRVTSRGELTSPERTRAITRTLNARYQVEPYGLGPGNAATTYPVSTFVTHLVYLRDCAVPVDVALISVRPFRSEKHNPGSFLPRIMTPIGTWGDMH